MEKNKIKNFTFFYKCLVDFLFPSPEFEYKPAKYIANRRFNQRDSRIEYREPHLT